MSLFLTLLNASPSHAFYSLTIHFIWSFSRNLSISLGFPFFYFLSVMLRFPFILKSVFNFPVLYFCSYFPFVSPVSFIFCLLFHFLPLGALIHVLFYMVCLFLSSFQFVFFSYCLFMPPA